jgi:hypothetical protein
VFILGSLAAAASLIRMLWMIWAFNAGYDPTMDEERKSQATSNYARNYNDAYT